MFGMLENYSMLSTVRGSPVLDSKIFPHSGSFRVWEEDEDDGDESDEKKGGSGGVFGLATFLALFTAVKEYVEKVFAVFYAALVGTIVFKDSSVEYPSEIIPDVCTHILSFPHSRDFEEQNFRHLGYYCWTENSIPPKLYLFKSRPFVVFSSSGELVVWYLRGFFDYTGFLCMLNQESNARRQANLTQGSKERSFSVFRIYERSGTPYMSIEHTVDTYDKSLNRAVDPVVRDYIRELISDSQKSSRTSYYFSDDMKELDREISVWRNSEKFFRGRNLPWKRGWIFHGPPGTGKSTAVKCMAEKHSLPVLVLDLATFTSNPSLVEAWSVIPTHTPCFLLIEDVDSVFNKKRENKIAGSSLTFDCFLNLLSGITAADGYFLILTTNKIEELDAAIVCQNEDGEIVTRPGRIDRAVYFGEVDQAGKEFIVNKILGNFPEAVAEVMAETRSMTISECQNRCIQRADVEFWKKLQAEKDPQE